MLGGCFGPFASVVAAPCQSMSGCFGKEAPCLDYVPDSDSCCGHTASEQLGCDDSTTQRWETHSEVTIDPLQIKQFSFRDRLLHCARSFENCQERNRDLAVELEQLRTRLGTAKEASELHKTVETTIAGVNKCNNGGEKDLANSADPSTFQVLMDNCMAEYDLLQQENDTLANEVQQLRAKEEQEIEKKKLLICDEIHVDMINGDMPGQLPRSDIQDVDEAITNKGSDEKNVRARFTDADPEIRRTHQSPVTANTSIVSTVNSLWSNKYEAATAAKLHWCRVIFEPFVESMLFRMIMTTALFLALFGPPLWTLSNIPDDPWLHLLDALMMTIMILFAGEVMLECIILQEEYFFSFFFFMDVLGTLSMAFEVSFLLGTRRESSDASKHELEVIWLRALRAAKIGARLPRIKKILSCVGAAFHFEMKRTMDDDCEYAKSTRNVYRKVTMALSTRVAVVTISLALFLPMIRAPVEDLSMLSWAQRLSKNYDLAEELVGFGPDANRTDIFFNVVKDCISFYEDLTYHPYKLHGFPERRMVGSREVSIPGQGALQSDDPVSAHSIVFMESDHRSADRYIYFDFTHARQLEAGFECISIALIIVVIVATSWDLSRVLLVMLVQPYDELIKTNCQQELLTEDEVAKLPLEQLGYREMVQDFDDITEQMEHKTAELRQTITTFDTRTTISTMRQSIADDLSPEIMDIIETSSFNVLEMSNQDLRASIAHLFFESSVAVVAFHESTFWVDPERFHCFITDVQSGYNNQPYHNFLHAVDILQTVFQFMKVTESVKWMHNIDQYALMIAALGHDIGHEGFTNEYLRSTGHSWALMYNDSSPLENMHCSKLLDICSKGKEECKDIFGRCSLEDQKEARKVIINCILHTDMAHHGEMVKEIKNVYVSRKEVCTHQAILSNGFAQSYEKEILHQNKKLWLQLFLHMADVSNPIKLWSMCELWADRVLQEFFNEGDEQKRLGIPVGHLNDRDVVNRPSSQYCFITFLVQPLLVGTVNIFPPFAPFYLQLGKNLERWFKVWAADAEANPTAEEHHKRELKVKEILDEAKALQVDARQAFHTPRSTVRMSRWKP
mmetsp:Transcript_124312/g.247824  ORF Transcript_124312/g.247824 Transcript_124312/m.247824 type:complete len:1077 (+) Transcript_124312:60-3290(+)